MPRSSKGTQDFKKLKAVQCEIKHMMGKCGTDDAAESLYKILKSKDD